MKRNSWIQERWATAREKQKFYNNNFNENRSVKEFFRNDNPLKDRVTKLDVTFQMQITGEGYEFFIPQETFSVYSFESPETRNSIEENTKQAISNIFRGRGQNIVYSKTDVVVRGVEKSQIAYNEVDYNRLKNSKSYYDNIPEVNVVKKKGSSQNKNQYKLDIWVN